MSFNFKNMKKTLLFITFLLGMFNLHAKGKKKYTLQSYAVTFIDSNKIDYDNSSLVDAKGYIITTDSSIILKRDENIYNYKINKIIKVEKTKEHILTMYLVTDYENIVCNFIKMQYLYAPTSYLFHWIYKDVAFFYTTQN